MFKLHLVCHQVDNNQSEELLYFLFIIQYKPEYYDHFRKILKTR